MTLNVGDKFRFGGYEGVIGEKLQTPGYISHRAYLETFFERDIYILLEKDTYVFSCLGGFACCRGRTLLNYLNFMETFIPIEPLYTTKYNEVMARYHEDIEVDKDNMTPCLSNYMFFTRTYPYIMREENPEFGEWDVRHFPHGVFINEYNLALEQQSKSINYFANMPQRALDDFYLPHTPQIPLYIIDPKTVTKLELGSPTPDTTPVNPVENLRFITPYDCFLVNKSNVVKVYIEANDEKKGGRLRNYENVYYTFYLPNKIFYLDNLYGYIEDMLAMSEEGYVIPELRDRRLYIENDTPNVTYLEYNPHGNCYEIGCPRCSRVYKPMYGVNRKR